MDALLPIIGHGIPLQARRPDCQNPYEGLQFEGRCFNDTRGYCAWQGISKGSKVRGGWQAVSPTLAQCLGQEAADTLVCGS